jgi:hypothetical protein
MSVMVEGMVMVSCMGLIMFAFYYHIKKNK